MANNQNDRTPQSTSGQDQKPQQGMPKDSGSQSQQAQPKSTDRDLKSPSDQSRSSDQNQKR